MVGVVRCRLRHLLLDRLQCSLAATALGAIGGFDCLLGSGDGVVQAGRLLRCQDHGLDDRQALRLHEHVLGAAEADALRAEVTRPYGVAWVIAVGPHAEPLDVVAPGQQGAEVLAQHRLQGLDIPGDDLSGAAVDGNGVGLVDDLAVHRGKALVLHVNGEVTCAGHTGQTELAGDHCRVAGGAAALRQDAFGDEHAVDIVRAGLLAHQDHALAGLAAPFRLVGVEDSGAGGGAGTGVEPLRQQTTGLTGRSLIGIVKLRQQQLVDRCRLDALDRLLAGD